MTNLNLEKLETAIRQALPELMELSEGCEVLINDDKDHVIYIGHIGEEKETMFFIDEDGEPEFLLDDGVIDKVDINIIGHPVTILHLLRWLDVILNEDGDEYYTKDMSLSGVISVKRYDNNRVWVFRLDLSKPLLSQQSDDVIDELVKLVK